MLDELVCVRGIRGGGEDPFDVPKTSSIALLVWCLAARGKPPGDIHPTEWQWLLDANGAWRQEYCMALGAWRCEMPARRSGTKFRLVTREARQEVLEVEWSVRVVARTTRFQMIALFSASDRVFGSLGTTTNLGSFWGTPLGVTMSSRYLCGFGDDNVTCYMGAEVDASEREDA
ncbi:hypothetical protein DEO72_LG1g2581 [Vigna unguiculata]|uniref:Uncharacterized protein n=1 Tax=Vigna unguiculata TaxID=3917 RepID=A0A4D6KQS2_VIGUN|nr:hypothetical protein DEO72_LG1g2581 [Vigna unguiculata]